jgi:hypothetical protein
VRSSLIPLVPVAELNLSLFTPFGLWPRSPACRRSLRPGSRWRPW